MRNLYSLVIGCVLLLALAACASGPDGRKREESLYLYAGAIRWGDINGALTFVDPESLEKRPMTAAERARYDQVQFAGYDVKSTAPVGDNDLLQIVEIRIVNKHTQVERVISDRQRWRWDDKANTWWLVSGLPDIGGR